MLELNHSPLLYWCNERPQAIALQSTQESLSYHALTGHVASLCEQLMQQGVTTGQHLGVITHTAQTGVMLQLACLHLGVVFCPISPYFKAELYTQLTQRLHLDAYWSDLTEVKLPCTAIELDTSRTASPDSLTQEINPERPLNMVLTSASSGMPKAVVHCWRNHYYSAIGSQAVIPLDEGDGWLLSIAQFHIGGQALIWRCLLAGARILIAEHKAPLEASLRQLPVTHLSVVPTHLYRLLKQPEFVSSQMSLRHILVGGASCNEQRLQLCQQRGFNVYISYGSSELSSQVATRKVDHGQGVGEVLPYREVRIQQGEVCVRGETLCLGYWDQGKYQPITSEDNWYHSRDLGYFESGSLVISGRADHMFICGGENIQPETIETQLLNHPQILSAVVIPTPSDEYGQKPIVFVDSQPRLTHQQICDYLRKFLSGLLIPENSYLLPQQGQLKVSREALKRALLSHNTNLIPL